MSKRPIVHLEIAAQDRVKAAEFYHTLFGWDINDMTEMNYTMLDFGVENLGVGVNQWQEGVPLHALIYIDSDDVAADLAAIEANGGQSLGGNDVPGIGTFGFFKDPAGVMMALAKFIPRSE